MLEGDIIIPIVRDISHGLRFLHSAKKPVVHGDLKSKNVLVDAQFRAKVRIAFFFSLNDMKFDKFPQRSHLFFPSRFRFPISGC